MTSAELVSWMAYDSTFPFGDERANLHAAIIASTVANGYSKRKVKPSDFMLKDEEQVKESNAKSFLTKIRALARNKTKPA